MSFSDVVEAIKSLSTEEKQEIQLLLEQYIREERREKIYENLEASQIEEHTGELKFSSDIRVLFYFAGEGKAVFVDIGNHDEVY